MNKWTVHVTDFGKIKHADVQVAPLTFFVGDNNSGKSYLMTLIYGLLNVQFYFDKYQFDRKSDAYQECCKILDTIFEMCIEMEDTYTLRGEEIEQFQHLANELLAQNKEKFLRQLFNRKMVMGEFWLEFDAEQRYRFEADRIYDTEDDEQKTILCGITDDGKSRRGYGMADKEDKESVKYDFFLSYILEYIIRKEFEKTGGEKVVYFPTARTGFLLTYKTLVANAMQDKFNMDETDKNLLTRPTSEFLSGLSRITQAGKTERYRNLIEFIEKNVISGHIRVSDMPTHDIEYVPDGEKQALPLFVTSGVVTEMTPLLLFLNYVKVGTLLIEEPEISLHPQLQWAMARVLVRLKNAGVPVFVTTHSDIILQHVNNMLKLRKNDAQDEALRMLGYDAEDLLSAEDVAVYQFDVNEEQRTIVTKLFCGEYGFEAMTFYNTLKKLNDEISHIESMEE